MSEKRLLESCSYTSRKSKSEKCRKIYLENEQTIQEIVSQLCKRYKINPCKLLSDFCSVLVKVKIADTDRKFLTGYGERLRLLKWQNDYYLHRSDLNGLKQTNSFLKRELASLLKRNERGSNLIHDHSTGEIICEDSGAVINALGTRPPPPTFYPHELPYIKFGAGSLGRGRPWKGKEGTRILELQKKYACWQPQEVKSLLSKYRQSLSLRKRIRLEKLLKLSDEKFANILRYCPKPAAATLRVVCQEIVEAL